MEDKHIWNNHFAYSILVGPEYLCDTQLEKLPIQNWK